MSLRTLSGDLSQAASAVTAASKILEDMPGPSTVHQAIGEVRATLGAVRDQARWSREAVEETASSAQFAIGCVGAAALLVGFYFASKIVREFGL